VLPAIATTATSFTDTNPPLLRKTPRWVFALCGAPVLVLSAGLGIYTLRGPAAAPGGSSTAAARVEGSVATPTPTPSVAGPEATSAVLPGELDASAATDPPAPSSAQAAQPVRRPRPALPNAATPAPPLRPSCNPPYTFDADGKKIWKRDCL